MTAVVVVVIVASLLNLFYSRLFPNRHLTSQHAPGHFFPDRDVDTIQDFSHTFYTVTDFNLNAAFFPI